MSFERTVLNPGLYRRLRKYYGDVSITNPGEAIDWELHWKVPDGNPDAPRRPVRQIVSGGEEYCVRCRLCKDDRARLYINHRWGVLDAETNDRHLFLAHCFNEECYCEWEAQCRLYEAIWSLTLNVRDRGGGQTTRDVLRGTPPAQRRNELLEMPDPGPVMRLDDLAKKHPGHPALRYLEERNFDPSHLGKYWGVGYCFISPKFRLAADRIFIPIRQDGMQVGWQMRYIGDDVDGVPFNVAGVPKYWTCPGMPKRLVAYNLERALLHSTLVIVEGVTDVWNLGPMATATLGMSMSTDMVKKIAHEMTCRHGSKALVVVMLDPQPPKRRTDKVLKHPIDVLVTKFASLRVPAIGVRLPLAFDPGSIERRLMIDTIKQQASEAGLAATFCRPQSIGALADGG